MEPYNPRIPPEDSDESEADLRVISEEEFLMLVLEEILRLNPVLPSTGWIYRTIMLEEQIEDVGPRTRAGSVNVELLPYFLDGLIYFLFFRNGTTLGIYVVMSTVVLETFIKIAIILLPFLLAFVFTFHILLANQVAFSSLINSLLKNIAMTIGEFELAAVSEKMKSLMNDILLESLKS